MNYKMFTGVTEIDNFVECGRFRLTKMEITFFNHIETDYNFYVVTRICG